MKFQIKHISKAYGRNEVLKDISFVAESGECIGFIGANGCGKTTLLSILAGVDKPDKGKIYINDKVVENVFSSKKNRIGYVPQINPLPDALTVKDCLKLWCDSRGAYNKIADRYALLEIERKRIGQLSGGMKRRVAIACAMACEPKILIMDEPTAALDINYKKLIHKDMEAFVRDGGILLMVTHEKEEMQMCSKCYSISDGVLNIHDKEE